MSEAAMRPALSDGVHYVSHGTPPDAEGEQAFTSECRAAVVTEVGKTDEDERTTVGLCVISPTGFFFHPLVDGGVPQAEQWPAGGTWHWPESCPGA